MNESTFVKEIRDLVPSILFSVFFITTLSIGKPIDEYISFRILIIGFLLYDVYLSSFIFTLVKQTNESSKARYTTHSGF